MKGVGHSHDPETLKILVDASADKSKHIFRCPCGCLKFYYSIPFNTYVCATCDASYRVTSFEDGLY